MDVRIGITTSLNDGEQRLHHAYVEAVERAGALPLIVPMLETDSALAAFADLIDGLVITGGPAITDGLVGVLPDDISETDPLRIRADKRIMEAFLDARKPILGICYGMQMLNAQAGGTLYADVARQVEGAGIHSDKRGGTEHPIMIRAGSVLHEILELDSTVVNTRHIQAVADVAAPYRVAAAAPDGTVEAIEDETGTILGVQFHPERMGESMLPLFRHLVRKARQQRRTN